MFSRVALEKNSIDALSEEQFVDLLNNHFKLMRMDTIYRPPRTRRLSWSLQTYTFLLSVGFSLVFTILLMLWYSVCATKRLEASVRGRDLLLLQNRILAIIIIQNACELLFPIANWISEKIVFVVYFGASFFALPLLFCAICPMSQVVNGLVADESMWSRLQCTLILIIFVALVIRLLVGLKKVVVEIPRDAEVFGSGFARFIGYHAIYFEGVFCVSLWAAVVGLMRPDVAGEMDNLISFVIVYSLCLVMTMLLVLKLTLMCLVRDNAFLWIYFQLRYSKWLTSFNKNRPQ